MNYIIKDSIKVVILGFVVSFLVIFAFAQTGPWSEPTASPPGDNLLSPLPVPAGTILAYGGATAPGGWLVANGAVVSRTEYANLFAAIGCNFGCPDASNFNIPDLRGAFLRGVDAGAGRDPDAGSRTALAPGGNTGGAVGSYQNDEFKSHIHTVGSMGHHWNQCCNAHYDNLYGSGGGFNTGPTGGSETRPKNVYVNYIIKY